MQGRPGAIGTILALFVMMATPASAAEGLDGRALGFAWSLPFIGLLLSMALAPLFLHRTWEHHYGKIAAGWSLLVLVPMVSSATLVPGVPCKLPITRMPPATV